MYHIKKIIIVFSLVLIFDTSYAQESKSSGVQLAFEHMVNTEVMELGKTYKNSFGEKFTPRSFKYYVSDIGFEDDSGKIHLVAAECFLVNEAEPESKRIAVNIPIGKYKKLSFILGVDSSRSVNGVQEGALDPYHGMFWTWNTGYVGAKLEGVSPSSKMPQQLFQYDIGGFRTGQNSLRTISIPLDSNFNFKSDAKTLVRINVNVQNWFDGKHNLKIAQHAFVHTPGELALQYADNCATMFSLDKLVRY